MIVTYDIYKRRKSDGKRLVLIQNYEQLSLTLNWKKRSKFQINGEGVKTCPFDMGDYVAIFRNAEPIFSGIVKNVEVECKNVYAGTVEWTVSGEDDGVIFDWRIILTQNDTSTSFDDITFDGEVYDKCEADAYTRMVHYIRNCFDQTKTKRERAIAGVTFPNPASVPGAMRGDTALSAYRMKKLSDVLKEIGDEYNLYAQYQWNPATGEKVISIPTQRDRTGTIIISPQFGNVSKWSVSRTFPKFNAVWVCSGNYDEVVNEGQEDEQTYSTRVWVYAEDTESIRAYGRIENTVSKSDIKITVDNEETEEDETLTEEEVIELLEEEARKQLQENGAKEKYQITLADTKNMHFMDDWKVGDLVKVIIDYDEATGKPKSFTSTIETVSIKYKGLEEEVKPTIGEVEEGLFGQVFEMISGIDKRLQNEEEDL